MGWVRSGGWVLLCALGACTARPAIDSSHRAVSQDSRVQFIVLHYTELDLADSLKRLTEADVSSHYLVADAPPKVYRLVNEERRAWHAGESSWQGFTHLNACSVGIEIVNPGNGTDSMQFAPFAPAQIAQVIALVRDVKLRHHVRADRIVGHGEIQPLTKSDPGPRFPWYELALAGLVPWPDPDQVARSLARFDGALPEPAWFAAKLSRHGYGLGAATTDRNALHAALRSFQMRYRPARYDGEPDAETAALLEVVTTPGGERLRAADGSWQPYASP